VFKLSGEGENNGALGDIQFSLGKGGVDLRSPSAERTPGDNVKEFAEQSSLTELSIKSATGIETFLLVDDGSIGESIKKVVSESIESAMGETLGEEFHAGERVELVADGLGTLTSKETSEKRIYHGEFLDNKKHGWGLERVLPPHPAGREIWKIAKEADLSSLVMDKKKMSFFGFWEHGEPIYGINYAEVVVAKTENIYKRNVRLNKDMVAYIEEGREGVATKGVMKPAEFYSEHLVGLLDVALAGWEKRGGKRSDLFDALIPSERYRKMGGEFGGEKASVDAKAMASAAASAAALIKEESDEKKAELEAGKKRTAAAEKKFKAKKEKVKAAVLEAQAKAIKAEAIEAEVMEAEAEKEKAMEVEAQAMEAQAMEARAMEAQAIEEAQALEAARETKAMEEAMAASAMEAMEAKEREEAMAVEEATAVEEAMAASAVVVEEDGEPEYVLRLVDDSYTTWYKATELTRASADEVEKYKAESIRGSTEQGEHYKTAEGVVGEAVMMKFTRHGVVQVKEFGLEPEEPLAMSPSSTSTDNRQNRLATMTTHDSTQPSSSVIIGEKGVLVRPPMPNPISKRPTGQTQWHAKRLFVGNLPPEFSIEDDDHKKLISDHFGTHITSITYPMEEGGDISSAYVFVVFANAGARDQALEKWQKGVINKKFMGRILQVDAAVRRRQSPAAGHAYDPLAAAGAGRQRPVNAAQKKRAADKANTDKQRAAAKAAKAAQNPAAKASAPPAPELDGARQQDLIDLALKRWSKEDVDARLWGYRNHHEMIIIKGHYMSPLNQDLPSAHPLGFFFRNNAVVYDPNLHKEQLAWVTWILQGRASADYINDSHYAMPGTIPNNNPTIRPVGWHPPQEEYSEHLRLRLQDHEMVRRYIWENTYVLESLLQTT